MEIHIPMEISRIAKEQYLIGLKDYSDSDSLNKVQWACDYFFLEKE